MSAASRGRRGAYLLLATALAGCGGDVAGSGLGPDPFWLDSDDATPADGGGDANANRVDATPTDSLEATPEDQDAATPADSGDATLADGGGGMADAAQDGQAQPQELHFAALLTSTEQTQDPSPFGDAWVEQTTTTLALVRVVWQGDVGTRWIQTCALHTTVAHGAKLTYPAAFLAAVPVEPAPLSRTGSQWSQPEVVEVVGLKSGYAGAMPKTGEAKHAALVDADGDDHPGVTLDVNVQLLGSNSLYVAQRARITWSGAIDGSGALYAEPTVLQERSVVGASLSLLVADTPSKAVAGKPAHTLRWLPLPGPIGCAALVTEAKARTGAPWPPPSK